MDISDAVESLDALAHETRVGVFRLLVQAGPDGLPAGDVAKRMGALQNTMSSHLAKLERAGLVASRREGRRVIYSANFAALSALILYLVEDCCGRNADLCAPIVASISC